MFQEFPEDDNNSDDFLNEFRQKISDQSFDNIEERKEELNRSKSVFLGIVGGIVLASVVGWMILAPQYRVESETSIPVIRRPQTAIRVQPNEPGGMDIPNQDKTVYNIIEKKDTDSVETLLPPPEMPKLPTIVAQDTPEDTTAKPIEVPIVEAEKIIKKEEIKASTITTEDIIRQAEQQTESVQKEVQVAEKETRPAEVKPQPVTEQPQIKKEVKEEPKPQPQKVQTAVAGNWQIQLMSSPNKPAVEKAKIDLGKKYKISHLPFEIEAAVLDLNKTFYRLKVGAFKTRAEADKLCNDIKNLGGTCIVKKK